MEAYRHQRVEKHVSITNDREHDDGSPTGPSKTSDNLKQRKRKSVVMKVTISPKENPKLCAHLAGLQPAQRARVLKALANQEAIDQRSRAGSRSDDA
jgi:hypothetical protein